MARWRTPSGALWRPRRAPPRSSPLEGRRRRAGALSSAVVGPGGHRMSVAYNDRVLIVARTRAGKSELLNVLASGLRSQWLMVDPKAEFAIADVEAVSSVDELDFRTERVLHFRPDAGTDRDEWE